MKLFYISKYAEIPLTGNPTRQFMLSKYMHKDGVDIKLIYSRSNGVLHKRIFGLHKTFIVDGIECILLNGILLKSLGFTIKRVFSWIQFELNLFFYFLFLKKNERPDVVIASSLSLLTFFTVSVLKKIYGFKMIIEVRDIWPLTLVESGKFRENNVFIRILKRIEIYGYENSDKIFSTLPKFLAYLKSQKIIDKSCVCITQGFDQENLSEIDTKEYITQDNFIVGYAGSIGNLDFVEELCEAAEILKAENIKFIIYGKGQQKDILQKKYSHLEKLIFAGSVPRKDIIKTLKNTDILVNMWGNKDIYQYGVSPNKWIDYMLAGKPILVSYNGYRSMINEANCGWFIDVNNPKAMADKILEISKMDRGVLKEIGENGRSYVESHCNYKTLAEKLLDFILN